MEKFVSLTNSISGSMEEVLSKSPLVSVITITHNRANLLGRAIQSVLGQTYENIEHIIVDAASTDNTFEVVNLDKYDMNLFDKLYSRLWAEFVWKNERGISKVNNNMKAESLFTEMVNEKEESGCSIFYELFIKDGRCYYCSFEYGKNSRKEALSAAIFDYDDNFKEKFLEPFFMYHVGINDVDSIMIDEINQDSKIANAFLINSKANIISIKGIEKEYIGALVNEVSKKSLRDR